MLDTGCDRSVIGRSLLCGETLLPSKYALTAAGQSPLQVDGETHIQFSIEGHPMEADVSVSPQLDDLLLGGDWLAKQGGDWSFTDGVIQFGDWNVRLRQRYADWSAGVW